MDKKILNFDQIKEKIEFYFGEKSEDLRGKKNFNFYGLPKTVIVQLFPIFNSNFELDILKKECNIFLIFIY